MEQINVSRQALSKWELDTAIPDTENILQISRLFSVSTDYLLYDEYESDDRAPAVQPVQPTARRIPIPAIIGSLLAALSVRSGPHRSGRDRLGERRRLLLRDFR